MSSDNTLKMNETGPVTIAVRTMRAAHPDRREFEELRAALLRRIANDLASIDRLEAVAGSLAAR